MRQITHVCALLLGFCLGCPADIDDDPGHNNVNVTASQYCYAESVSEIEDCIDDVSAHSIGGTVEIGPGLYYPTDTLEINASNVTIRGAGVGATYISWKPTTSGDPLFKFARTGAWSVARGRISDLFLYSNTASYTGTALELVDVADFEARNIDILGFDTGIKIAGRDSVTFSKLSMRDTDKPVELHHGATYDGNADFFTFRDVIIHEAGSDDAIFWLDPDLRVHSLLIENASLVGGSYGLHWDESEESPGNSYSIIMRNVRREQNPTTGCFCFINRAAGDWLNVFRGEAIAIYGSDGLCINRARYVTAVDSVYVSYTSGNVFDDISNATGTKLEQNFVVETP